MHGEHYIGFPGANPQPGEQSETLGLLDIHMDVENWNWGRKSLD